MLSLLLSAITASATDSDERRPLFLTTKIDVGTMANTNDFLDGVNAHQMKMKNFSAYTLGVGWQTTGRKDWEHIHNFPSFGVAVYTATLDNKAEIGRPYSVFGFYNGTMWRKGRSAIKYNIDMGVAFNWKCYDKYTNPYNITIGSPATVHIGLGVEYRYSLDNLSFAIGYNATHFSNGAVRKPNKGLNMLSPFVKIAYSPRKYSLPELKTGFGRLKGHEVLATFGFGIKRYECDTVAHPEVRDLPGKEFQMGSKFTVGTLQLEYLRTYGHKGRWGGGLSIVYDNWLGSDIRITGNDVTTINGPASKRYTVGLFLAHELCIDRLSVVTQLGRYIHQPSGVSQKKKDLFERAGVKYTLPFNVFAGLNIYAHSFTKADFIEWNVGYRLPWGEKVKSK